MPNSNVNLKLEFNQNVWVVTLVNSVAGTNGILGGHAVIVVEGINKDNRLFQGEYDITANSFPEEQDSLQETLGNTLGVITKIRCNPLPAHRQLTDAPTAAFHRDYATLPIKSWYVSPKLALDMITSIENDAKLIDDEVSSATKEGRNVQWPFKYQKAGSYRWNLWGGNGGENCVTWAEKKLAIAGAGNGKIAIDSKKAAPFVHVNCTVS